MATVSAFRTQNVGTSPVTLFTASASTSECESIDILNVASVAVRVSLYHETAGATKTYILYTFGLDAGASLQYRGAIVFDENTSKLIIVSDTASSLDVVGRVTTF